MAESKNNLDASSERTFTVTHVGQMAVEYREGQKLTFPKKYNDERVASEVNLNSGLQFIDIGFLKKNEQGEICFGIHMDGITFQGVVLKIKEVA